MVCGTINKSGLFGDVVFYDNTVIYDVLAEDFIEEWKSHETVYRQSLEKFEQINKEIKKVIMD